MTAVRTTGDALLEDVLAHPDDDTPRLIYADWLDEPDNAQGDPARAKLIRMGCALVQPCEPQRRTELLVASELLLRDHALRWTGGLLGTRGSHATWKRGFVDRLTLPGNDFVKHADALLAQHPILNVHLTDAPSIQILQDGRGLRFLHRPNGKCLPTPRPNPNVREDITFPLLRANWPKVRRFTIDGFPLPPASPPEQVNCRSYLMPPIPPDHLQQRAVERGYIAEGEVAASREWRQVDGSRFNGGMVADGSCDICSPRRFVTWPPSHAAVAPVIQTVTLRREDFRYSPGYRPGRYGSPIVTHRHYLGQCSQCKTIYWSDDIEPYRPLSERWLDMQQFLGRTMHVPPSEEVWQHFARLQQAWVEQRIDIRRLMQEMEGF